MKKLILFLIVMAGCSYYPYDSGQSTLSFDDTPVYSSSYFRLPEPEPYDFSKGVFNLEVEPRPRYGVPNCDGIRDYPMTGAMYKADRMHDPLLGRPSRPGSSLLSPGSMPGDSLLR